MLSAGTRAWAGLAIALGVASALVFALVPSTLAASAIDWQPGLAAREPWRALTAALLHFSALHLGANLAGCALVGALGVAARVPGMAAAAWVVAWPLTQLGLAARPDLAHFGGLSGVLHAGAAIVAVHLLVVERGARRAIGAALLLGLVVKVLVEAPWGPALRHPEGWDIATAPFAHACGLAAGTACAVLAALWRAHAPAWRGPAGR